MSLKATIKPEYIASKASAHELVRSWRLTKKHVNQSKALQPGNFIFTKYIAITPKVYDVNPVVIIIRANKKYVLGFNINWLRKHEKRRLLDFLIRNDIQSKTRLARIPVIRKLRRLRYPRRAYRLYFRKELAKPRLYQLTSEEMFLALSRNLREEIRL